MREPWTWNLGPGGWGPRIGGEGHCEPSAKNAKGPNHKPYTIVYINLRNYKIGDMVY